MKKILLIMTSVAMMLHSWAQEQVQLTINHAIALAQQQSPNTYRRGFTLLPIYSIPPQIL